MAKCHASLKSVINILNPDAAELFWTIFHSFEAPNDKK